MTTVDPGRTEAAVTPVEQINLIIDGFEVWANNEAGAIEKYRLWCLPCWD